MKIFLLLGNKIMKIIFISTISIAILSTYTIAATTRSDGTISIESIDAPYTKDLALLATRRVVNDVVIHTNERLKIIDTNFIVNAQSISTVGSNLGAAGDAIQANHNALVDLELKNSIYIDEWNNMFKESISKIESQISQNRKVSSRGIAGVAAMTNIPTLTDGSFSVGMGYGYFDGEDALAFGVSKYFNSGVAIKTSFATTGANNTTLGIGASYSFK
ncbi:YadA C-terminal domain-containing protein [Aliivibrio salmonicida]|nr:YadA C-terminal domain-containing protein [Aliivibrio salmonicida]